MEIAISVGQSSFDDRLLLCSRYTCLLLTYLNYINLLAQSPIPFFLFRSNGDSVPDSLPTMTLRVECGSCVCDNIANDDPLPADVIALVHMHS